MRRLADLKPPTVTTVLRFVPSVKLPTATPVLAFAKRERQRPLRERNFRCQPVKELLLRMGGPAKKRHPKCERHYGDSTIPRLTYVRRCGKRALCEMPEFKNAGFYNEYVPYEPPLARAQFLDQIRHGTSEPAVAPRTTETPNPVYPEGQNPSVFSHCLWQAFQITVRH